MNDKARAAETARKIARSGITFGVALGIYTLAVSRGHITHIGYAIGLSKFEAETLFLLVDFIAVFGKVMTHPRLSARTRRIGREGLLAGLGLSLACNVVSGLIAGGIIPEDLSGGGIGPAGYGAFIVTILVWIERAVSSCKPKANIERKAQAVQPSAPAAPLTITAPPQPAPSRRCTQGCTCARHRPRAGRTPQPPAAAPVSPAYASKVAPPEGGLLVPDLATVQRVAAGVR